MKTLIAGLKWLSKFLENRFPEKVDFAQLATKKEVNASYDDLFRHISELEKTVASHKDQLQTISLRVGLARPIQTVLQKRS